MRCSRCGIENPIGKKFCGDCGAPLANLCPQCGADNPAGQRFCGECGTALGASAAASAKKSEDTPIRVADTSGNENLEGERKTVTALFADIKGSMELMEDLDPEEARGIVDPALKLMIDAAHRYDGYIVQSTGDGIFALFGAPIAHEDHPQRALYAALRMQDEVKRYAERLRAEKGFNLQVPRRSEQRRGCGSVDQNWGRPGRVHADRPLDQSRLALTSAGGSRFNCDQRNGQETDRRILCTQAAGPGTG